LTLLNAAVQELIVIDRDHFNSLEAYISTVESPCTVDSTLSNLRLLPWLDIGIVSTLPRFLHYGLYSRPGLYTWVDITPSSTRSRFRLTSQPTTYGLLGRTPYDWSYCLGNTRATNVYRVYPGWGSRRVTCCLANPEAVADTELPSSRRTS
jgi:hypothetical protein